MTLILAQVLKRDRGDSIRAGIVEKGITDDAYISTDPRQPGGLSIHMGRMESLRVPARPKVDLVIAYPRPKKIRNLMATITTLGVNRIVFVPPYKIEKGYLGKRWLLCGYFI